MQKYYTWIFLEEIKHSFQCFPKEYNTAVFTSKHHTKVSVFSKTNIPLEVKKV